MRRTGIVGVLAAEICLCCVAASAGDGAAQAAQRVGTDFRQIVQDAKAQVFPAVVYIRIVSESNEQGKKSSQQSSGSGVIISPSGLVLTNWHVVDQAISVRCLLYDGRAMKAEVIGSDQDTDLAVIQLELDEPAEDVPYAEIGDSTTLVEGDFVMVMGAPYGLNRSVSIGIVSCTRRYLPEISEYSLWIQTDAAINPGNSGGPMVNTEGQVIGINSRGMNAAEGMGFAIPGETVSIVMPRLRADGRMNWSWTGLQLQPLQDFNREIYFDETEGLIVGETDPESPARRAGVHAGDRILRVNGQPITATTEEDLPAARLRFGMLPLGEAATIELVRNGETKTIELTPREKGDVEGEELACKRWDLTFKTINQFDNAGLYFHRKKGVFVYATKWPGNASESGLRRNDIVLQVDGKPVETLDDIKAIHEEAVANVASKHRMKFTVLRGGLMRQLVLDYSRDHSKE